MKAAIVDGSGKLLYYGNTDNAKYKRLVDGNTVVNTKPEGDIWDGTNWSTTPPAPTPDITVEDLARVILDTPANRAKLNNAKKDRGKPL